MKHNRLAKEILAYGAFFIAALLIAAWTSMPHSGADDSRKSIFSVDPDKVGEISLKGAESSTLFKPFGKNRFWITTDRSRDPVKEEFLGSPNTKDVLALLNPLQAIREIGKVEADKRSEYGLGDKQVVRQLSVVDTKGKEIFSAKLGKQAYGTRNVFASIGKDESVVLLPGDLISDLEKPEARLYERQIATVVYDELTGAEIASGEQKLTLSHTKRDDKGQLLWTLAEGKDGAVGTYKSWFDRLSKLRVSNYVAVDQQEEIQKIQPFLEVRLEGTPDSETLQFRKRGAADKEEYFVTSSILSAVAQLPAARMQPIEKDLPNLFKE
jgi:hypothetical protein